MRTPRNRWAALLLIVLAPLVAEVSLGNIALSQLWVIVFFVPIYGGGALLIREVVRRTGGGFPALLLLGVAYGLVEEGLALQSLTSPHLYGAAEWAPRLFGVNTAYALLNLVYHPVFSIAVPIALVELIFARHGTRPYLRRGGVITAGVVAVLGAALIRLTVPPSQDPGYTMPLTAVVLIAVLAIAVIVAALRIHFAPARAAEPPRVLVLAGATAVASFAFLALIWPFGGARQPMFTHGNWSLLPVSAAALLVVAAVHVLRRWSAGPQWTSRHLLAACVGALAGHTAFGILGNAVTWTDRLALAAVLAVTLALGLGALYADRFRRPARRSL